MEGRSLSTQNASQHKKHDRYLAVHRNDDSGDHSTGDHYSHGPPQKRSRSNSSANHQESSMHSFQHLDFHSNQSSGMNDDEDKDEDFGLVDVSEDENYEVQEECEILESSNGLMNTLQVCDTCVGMVSYPFFFVLTVIIENS